MSNDFQTVKRLKEWPMESWFPQIDGEIVPVNDFSVDRKCISAILDW